MSFALAAGSPQPLGVTPTATGVNVAVFSANGTRVEFCLFDEEGNREIARIALPERSGDIHHGHIAGVHIGARYGLRVHGPYEPARGHRFNPNKLLIDPHASLLDRPFTLHRTMFGFRAGEGHASFDTADSAPFMPKCIVAPAPAVHDRPRPDVPWLRTILYELNVRGFTKLHPDVAEPIRGRFAGLGDAAAVSHLKSLGITSVELLPAMAWIDERHLPPLGLTNAWGYNPVLFGAPEPRLAPGGWDEVRSAIASLHDAGLEVILDVVLNHSGESDELGPTISFRGLDNAAYYRLDPADPARYINDMGCGNCLALDRPHVVQLSMDGLRQWARAGIDGFRFDLATALGRRPDGFDPAAPLLTALDQDPELGRLKLIAEPWDIGPGGYQTGHFPDAWGEWNDHYRDTIRRFWRGDGGQRNDLATRITGSADLFGAKRRPSRSINFVTAHDGFTLADLVSYSGKHNDANGEHNRDGTNDNHSWNHGVEGPTGSADILAARRRDQINLLATLLFSRGTPMLAMGSEFGHGQRGNNNAYAQDNAISWLDWRATDPAILAATRALIAARNAHPLLADDRFLTGEMREGLRDAEWFRPDGAPMGDADWADANADTLILALASHAERLAFVIHRGDWDCLVTLPTAQSGMAWKCVFDTAHPEAPHPDHAASPVIIVARSVALFAQTSRSARGTGADPATIDALAQLGGIGPTWWDHGGTLHTVSQEAKRALLSAMGLDVSSRTSAGDALAALRARSHRGLAETAWATETRPIRLKYRSNALSSPSTTLVLIAEDGNQTTVPAEVAPLVPSPDGSLCTKLVLPPLATGHYQLVDERAPQAVCHLTIAPPRCHGPDGLRNDFGVSAQLYALRSAQDQGIGDLTTLAVAASAAARAGAATFGINPLHTLFASDPERASPYHPSDRRFLEPTAIDITALGDLPESPLSAQLFKASLPEFDALRRLGTVDYHAVSGLKHAYLRAKFEAFRTAQDSAPALWGDFLRFTEASGEALALFTAFRLIEQQQSGPWWTWPDGLADSASAPARQLIEQSAREPGYEAFCQWLADRQFGRAADTARSNGLRLGLYRDLAVGCAPDGGEAWAERNAFAAGASVGAPPDPFSANGQIWNLPPPNPLTLGEGGYRTFRRLIAANMRHAGMLRIDHVMGLTRLFWVPDGAKTADGAYVEYPRDALLAELALESQRARCIVVGEDLGTVPDGFREALTDKGMLSYRVLWFEREGENFRAPQSYPAQAVACVSTHDLATLAGWWSGADIDEQVALGRLDDEGAARTARSTERWRLVSLLIDHGFLDTEPTETETLPVAVAAAIHAYIAATPSLLALIQTDDLAGETVAINLPGTDRERPNWRRRLAEPVETLFQTPLASAIIAAMLRLRPQ